MIDFIATAGAVLFIVLALAVVLSVPWWGSGVLTELRPLLPARADRACSPSPGSGAGKKG